MSLPFNENIINDFNIRSFSANVLDEELKWHWDQEDREVTCEHETDWMFQMDNQLPIKIEKNKTIFIPEGEYHRIIKGTGDLTLKVKKLK